MTNSLVIDDGDRYARLRLIAWWDQQKLAQAKVLVVGAGALGNEVLKNLALVGWGSIYVVDFEAIEPSNLTRAVLFRQRDCGRPKAEVAAAALRDLNPDVRVKPLAADIITDVGLGLFRDMDVVIGCLDNREARLWVNRQCWKSGTPWIDGGIQEINGVVKVFVPPDSPCYECAMTENDYRLINLRYSCPLLRREDLVTGKVPTSPTISSMIAGLQTQEALKLIHGVPVAAGQALIYNGVANQFYSTRLPRREDCLSHDTLAETVEVNLSASQHTAEELFAAVRRQQDHGQHAGQPRGDGQPLRLELERDLVVSIDCPACQWQRPVMRPLQRVGMEAARCTHCNEWARPRLVHAVTSGEPLAREKLAALGIPPYDVVRVNGGTTELPVLLGGDREAVVGLV